MVLSSILTRLLVAAIVLLDVANAGKTPTAEQYKVKGLERYGAVGNR
jgi:hypothetical protein